VHNELIRDDNFVLVGRGVYTINTDNYVNGTVKDVIENVLQNSDEPLSSQEVIDRVLEMRSVKPSTIKVNLNAVAKKMNKKYTLDTNVS
jgi:DNA-binding winged helix-turn-helix (wHTH) protein